MLTLDDVKAFLRIDTSEDDAFLSSLMLVSDTWIKNATDQSADNTTEIYKLAQLILILKWYENREGTGSTSDVPYHLESLLVQIKAVSYTPPPVKPYDPFQLDPTGNE